SNRTTELNLQRTGLQTRAGNLRSWRIMREFVSMERAIAFARKLARSAEIRGIAWWARLERHKYSLHPASQLRETMIVPVLAAERIGEDEIVAVDGVRYRGPVYDLNVSNPSQLRRERHRRP